MDDKKLNNTPDEKATDATIDAASKPVDLTKEELAKAAKDETLEFGAAGVDDINKNLGSFGETVVKAEEPAVKEIKLDVDAKVVEKAAAEKIDFERFKKTKKVEKEAKTKIGEKISIMLRSKKGLKTTWAIEMIVMVFTIVVAALLLAFFTRWWGYNNPEKPAYMAHLQSTIKPGIVFCWIALFPCLIPLIYLLTTWFIGINQVASSRTYHIIFWFFAGFALLCLIIGLCLLIPCWIKWVTVPAYW